MTNVIDAIEQRAEVLTQRYGCKNCGKVGCNCKDVSDTFAASVCHRCQCSPCQCEGKLIARVQNGICTVCRRAACICTSHHPVKAMLDVAVRPQRFCQRPYSEPYLDVLVNQGMNHYYNRDADGLARWLRKALA